MTTPTTTTQPAREAIALGATLIAQAQGDVAKARRGAEAATRWLRAIDPEYAPPPDEAAALREANVSLTRDLLLAQRDAKAATATLATVRAELAAALASVAATPSPAAVQGPEPVAPAAVQGHEPVAPAAPAVDPKAAYRAARAQQPVPVPVPAVTAAAPTAPSAGEQDPFGHLPPAMREWARARAQQPVPVDRLEID